jgi:hypothetical protein
MTETLEIADSQAVGEDGVLLAHVWPGGRVGDPELGKALLGVERRDARVVIVADQPPSG